MSRAIFPYSARDISGLARALRTAIEAKGQSLGHVQILNILAKAAGFKNYQHFRSHTQPATPVETRQATAAVEHAVVERVLRLFTAEGCLIRWPSKAKQRRLCLWVLWSRLAPGTSYTERQIGVHLKSLHLFNDHALLRRELCDQGLVFRTKNGSEYRRIEQRPPAEFLALSKRLKK